MIHRVRGWVMPVLAALALGLALASALWQPAGWLALVALVLFAVGLHDLLQTRHGILRTYPVLGHIRFLLEDAGPELRQYIVEDNIEGRPFDRDTRSLVYQRSKGVLDKKPFGTEQDVYAEGYGWVAHSMRPLPPSDDAAREMRITLGGPECTHPYSASVLNVSAMSFGALSSNAVLALNSGARLGGFAQNTGEGGISRYHRAPGGDLIWQVGTGYFGCRTPDGDFDAERFREQAALDAVKAIELKISQGAKPGHGGILPGVKVTPEIAEARGVPVGRDCLSPPAHRVFDTPTGLLEFLARLRELSGGKPVGMKLALGDPVQWMSVCRAIVAGAPPPDFVTVDGGEGGTGAAPIEFSDHVGMPLKEALLIVHQSLVGIGVRDRVRVLAAGKLVTSFEMAAAFALGADAVNSARGFMFALGCIQAQQCHSNRCPVGVTTQDAWLRRALIVERKAERVHHFHSKTVEAFAEMIGAAGLCHPRELEPQHLYRRVNPWEIRTLEELYPRLEPGALLDGGGNGLLRGAWDAADASRFGGCA